MRLRCSLYHRNIRCFAFLPAGPYNPTEGRLIVEAQAWCWRTGGSDHGRRFAEHGGGAAGLRLGPLPHPRRACAAALVAGHFEERARLLEVSVARRRGSRGRARAGMRSRAVVLACAAGPPRKGRRRALPCGACPRRGGRRGAGMRALQRTASNAEPFGMCHRGCRRADGRRIVRVDWYIPRINYVEDPNGCSASAWGHAVQ